MCCIPPPIVTVTLTFTDSISSSIVVITHFSLGQFLILLSYPQDCSQGIDFQVSSFLTSLFLLVLTTIATQVAILKMGNNLPLACVISSGSSFISALCVVAKALDFMFQRSVSSVINTR